MEPKRILSSYPPPYRLNSHDLEFYKEQTLKGQYNLDKNEKKWRDRAEFLETRGYRLRPRFRKDWKPSWLGTNLHPVTCEDSQKLLSTRIIDATRISDGKCVVLKCVRRHTDEVGLAQSLHIESRSEDPDNHCVPILEYFDDLEDRTLGYLVMPILRCFDDPPFGYISEIMDFINQTLTGLRFLHRNKVAHRDLSGANIMMDGDSLYPTGFHPSHQWLNPVTTADAHHINRRDAPLVKYYIIDFGISAAFDDEGKEIKDFEVFRKWPKIPDIDPPPVDDTMRAESDAEALEKVKARLRRLNPNVNLDGIENRRPPSPKPEPPPFMVLGKDALDREIPELSSTVPYDPFLVDIFTLGNTYKKDLLQKYSNLECLSPLVESMTQTDPKMRPKVDEAIEHFQNIKSKMTPFQLCLPLRPAEKPPSRPYMAIMDMTARIREFWVLTLSKTKRLSISSWFRIGGVAIFTFASAILPFRRFVPRSN